MVLRGLLGLALALATPACNIGLHRTPVEPWVGGLFHNTRSPVETKVQGAETVMKVGRSASHQIFFFLIAFGDCSVGGAAKRGGIETIESVEHRYMSVFGIYRQYETIVYGIGPEG